MHTEKNLLNTLYTLTENDTNIGIAQEKKRYLYGINTVLKSLSINFFKIILMEKCIVI